MARGMPGFSGYSPHSVATAWIGYDENHSLGRNEFGGSAALPIWMEFMKTALAGKKEVYHPQPEGLVTVKINPTTGERTGYGESGAIFEIFRKENVPALSSTPQNPNQDGSGAVLPEDIF